MLKMVKSMENVFLLGGLRSHIGLTGGMFKTVPAEDLAAAVLEKLIATYPCALQADGLIYTDTPYHVEGLGQPCTLRDTGYFNEEGYLIFNGRENDIVNKGGFKISCTKVENVLNSFPEVVQAVVLPYGDAGRGQEAAAFLACDKKVSRREMRQRLRKLLMQQEMPKTILFLKEIPLNSRGKTDKAALLHLLEEKE